MIDRAARVCRAARHAARGVLDAALPQTCITCGVWIPAEQGCTCPPCRRELASGLAQSYCPRCGRTLPSIAIHDDHCAACRAEPFWNVARVARVGLYTPAMRSALLALKHRGDERIADYLADLLARALHNAAWPDRIDALVPVPMHWLRRLQRPCNHAQLLTAALAHRLRLPIVQLVRRAKHTPSQTGMDSKTRRFENVQGCFGPSQWWQTLLLGGSPFRTFVGRSPHTLDNLTLCIVDNLLVSGATVHEVSKVLRKAGARRIYALVAARSPAPGDAPISLDALAPLPLPPT